MERAYSSNTAPDPASAAFLIERRTCEPKTVFSVCCKPCEIPDKNAAANSLISSPVAFLMTWPFSPELPSSRPHFSPATSSSRHWAIPWMISSSPDGNTRVHGPSAPILSRTRSTRALAKIFVPAGTTSFFANHKSRPIL